MNNDPFDVLKQEWRTQPPLSPMDPVRVSIDVRERFEAARRQHRRGVIRVTILFAATIVWLGGVASHTQLSGRPWLIAGLSIVAVTCLAWLPLIWISVIRGRRDPTSPLDVSIERQLSALRLRLRMMREYRWIWSLVLLVGMEVFFADSLVHGWPTVFAGGTVFMILVLAITELLSRRSIRRKTAEINGLIAELQRLRAG